LEEIAGRWSKFIMPLTTDQLRNGIDYWLSEQFPPDFHNSFYEHDLVALQANGLFNQKWWDNFLPALRSWGATRGTADVVITAWAQARFEALRKAWSDAVVPYVDKDIAEVDWDQIASFPSLVAEIKGVASPVFTSKFCHFLAPRLFPVTDKKLLGLPYQHTSGTSEHAELNGSARRLPHKMNSFYARAGIMIGQLCRPTIRWSATHDDQSDYQGTCIIAPELGSRELQVQGIDLLETRVMQQQGRIVRGQPRPLSELPFRHSTGETHDPNTF
jgi:hypothetical protein